MSAGIPWSQTLLFVTSAINNSIFNTHERLKERFLIRRNRTKRAHFREVIFFKLHTTIQQKTVKPIYLVSV